MKKYIVPNTETNDVIRGAIICGSPNAGTGQQENPVINPGQDPNAAPGRVF